MTLRDQQREFSVKTREALLATFQENPFEWFTAKELADAAGNAGIEEVTAAQIGGLLKLMRSDGLVENKPEKNFNVWRLVLKDKKAKAHPWTQTPAVIKTRRPAPVTRPLPVHLESKQDPHIQVPACPLSALDELLVDALAEKNADEALVTQSWSAVIESIEADDTQPLKNPCELPAEDALLATHPIQPETPMTAEALAYDTTDAIEMPFAEHQQAPHTCTGHCANHARASDDIEAALARAADQAKLDYVVHLLTIADEHAETGDDLGSSPVWKTARRLAPAFGLEKTYA